MHTKLYFSHLVLWLGCAFILAGGVLLSTLDAQDILPTPTLNPDATASPVEIAKARADWEQSEHAHTFDGGMGADTTCARCKSPMNWNPTAPSADAALDCASCKRIPGELRPFLAGSEPVDESDWQHIDCPICHEPVGESYRIAPSFWNQQTGIYETVESNHELCAHCHEGQHGFEVVEEMQDDQTHPGWDCLDCHGPHGDDIQCVDCHDIYVGAGALEHANHPAVACSACHDQGGLALWQERDPASEFYGNVVTIRFAHTLTSWPSHNLRTEVQCGRCHHGSGFFNAPIAATVSCNNAACHPQDAVLNWCPVFNKEKP